MLLVIAELLSPQQVVQCHADLVGADWAGAATLADAHPVAQRWQAVVLAALTDCP